MWGVKKIVMPCYTEEHNGDVQPGVDSCFTTREGRCVSVKESQGTDLISVFIFSKLKGFEINPNPPACLASFLNFSMA